MKTTRSINCKGMDPQKPPQLQNGLPLKNKKTETYMEIAKIGPALKSQNHSLATPPEEIQPKSLVSFMKAAKYCKTNGKHS